MQMYSILGDLSLSFVHNTVSADASDNSKDKFIKTADLPTINVDASATQLAPGQEGVESPVDTRTPEEILAQEGSVEVVEDTSEVVEPTSPAPLPTEATGELVGGDAAAPTVIPGEVSYTVLGSNFAYDITEMKVKEGDKVTVTFRSTDGFHDWVVDEFDAATEKEPVVFLDRGLPDVLAYMDYIGDKYPQNFVDVCKTHHYDYIFILAPWQAIFTSDSERYENFEQAIEIHDHLVNTYKNFGYKLIDVPFDTVENRTDFILNSIKN